MTTIGTPMRRVKVIDGPLPTGVLGAAHMEPNLVTAP
jgi:hypothetical protein